MEPELTVGPQTRCGATCNHKVHCPNPSCEGRDLVVEEVEVFNCKVDMIHVDRRCLTCGCCWLDIYHHRTTEIYDEGGIGCG